MARAPQNILREPRLVATAKALRGTQRVIPAPIPDASCLPNIKIGTRFRTGNSAHRNILIVIPTANAKKAKCVEDFIATIPDLCIPGGSVIIEKYNANSDAGEQPYEQRGGSNGACNRVTDTMRWLNSDRGCDFVDSKQAREVIIISFENFIETTPSKHDSTDDMAVSGNDYAYCIWYNATRQTTYCTISRGVTVPEQYLNKARSQGFEDEEQVKGLVTMGEVIAANVDTVVGDVVEGVPKDNWHLVFCGEDRYAIIRKALEVLYQRAQESDSSRLEIRD